MDKCLHNLVICITKIYVASVDCYHMNFFHTFLLVGIVEFLKLNPLGYVPVLVDGDFVVADSFAILLVNFFIDYSNIELFSSEFGIIQPYYEKILLLTGYYNCAVSRREVSSASIVAKRSSEKGSQLPGEQLLVKYLCLEIMFFRFREVHLCYQ